jgi:hypothetical protein
MVFGLRLSSLHTKVSFSHMGHAVKNAFAMLGPRFGTNQGTKF